MTTTIRKLVLVVALMLVQTVVAQPRITVDAIEMSPSNIILPGSSNGTMTFKPCDGVCKADYKRARLTENTKYTVNGKRVKYSEFRREFAAIKMDSGSYALVLHATETNTIRSIDIAS
jgi:hypothetical protein